MCLFRDGMGWGGGVVDFEAIVEDFYYINASSLVRMLNSPF